MAISGRVTAVLSMLLTWIATARGDARAAVLGPAVMPYVVAGGPQVAVVDVRVIDGTGAAAREHQTVLFRDGRIARADAAARVQLDSGVTRIDGRRKTLIPGLVGTHDHLFYVSGPRPDGFFIMREQWYSFPRLYLAGGVTTLRTAGSVEPYTDLNLRRLIDDGTVPGPSLDVTAPYLTGPSQVYVQMAQLHDEDEARRTVRYWASMGATSFKLYTEVSLTVARAVIEEAHALHLPVLGHLCSIGFHEAAELGIDSLEHGIFVDSEFDPEKKPDACPATASFHGAMLATDSDGPKMQALIADLVAHHVAVSSTLPIYETFGSRPLDERTVGLLAPEVRVDVEAWKQRLLTSPVTSEYEALLRKEMRFERAFVHAGGLLTVGPDPTGAGAVVAGYGDQRCLELLVDAGFSATEAIKIATRNGAELLQRLDNVGTIEVGKRADAVLIDGDPSTRIADVEKVEIVFKEGVGYDSARMIQSVRGNVGRR